MNPIDKSLIKQHLKNYKKLQKKEMKENLNQQIKIQKQEKLTKQLSKLGLLNNNSKNSVIDKNSIAYLFRNRNEIIKENKNNIINLYLFKNKSLNKSLNSKKEMNRFKMASTFKKYLNQIISDPSYNKDDRLRNTLITNIYISEKEYNTVYIKWMLPNYGNSFYNETINHLENYSTNMELTNLELNQNSPEIYKIEKINNLFNQASGFFSSLLSKHLDLKYAPKLIFSPIITNIEELEYLPESLQNKYNAIIELKKTFDYLSLQNDGIYDKNLLIIEQLECDEFRCDMKLFNNEKKDKVIHLNLDGSLNLERLNTKNGNGGNAKNGEENSLKGKKIMRRRPLSALTF
ncbi:hypothetical protein ABK040_015259 [Willaertia magna]